MAAENESTAGRARVGIVLLSICVFALSAGAATATAQQGPDAINETTRSADALGTVQPEPANETVRLTDNDVADRPPTVASGEDGPVAVWAGRAPGKTELEGFELYSAARSDGSWSEKTQLTDDQRLDIRPAVASGDGSQFVAWSREEASGGFGITAARLSEDGLGERLQLTQEGDALHLNAVVAGTGDRWLVAWFVDQDGDLTTTEDHAVRYTLVDGPTLDVLESGTVADNSAVDVTSAGGEFVLAVGSSDSVERVQVSEDGTEQLDSFETRGVTDVAVSADATAWATAADTEEIVVDGDSRTTLETTASSIRDLSFAPGAPRPTISYQARFSETDGAVPAYHVSTDSGWSGPRLLSLPDSFATTDLGVTATEDQLFALASAIDDPAGTADLFAISQPFRPDLSVNATAQADSAAVGSETTIEYTVTNDGDTASPPTVVILRDNTGGIDSMTVPALGVGETAAGTFSATVGRAGKFEVMVDPGGAIAERDQTNNDDLVVLAQPDLAVTGVEERREGDRLELSVTVANRGTAPAKQFSVRVEAGNQTATGSFPGLGAGREVPVTVGLNVTEFSSSVSATVTADPDGAVAEPDTTDNTRLIRLLQPDLAILEPVVLNETSDGARVDFQIRNGNTGGASTTVTVVTPEEVQETTVEVPAARSRNDTVVVPASVSLSTLPEADEYAIRAEADGVDADPTNNVYGQVPGGFPEPSSDLSLSIQSPEQGATVEPSASVPITVNITNDGDGRARETLELDGVASTERAVEVPPDSETEVTVEMATPDSETAFDVTATVGSLSETRSVEVTNQSGQSGGGGTPASAGDDGINTILIVAAVILVGFLAYRRLSTDEN